MTKLRAQATLNLDQRVSDFKLRHPDKVMNKRRLRTIYKEAGVRYKKVIAKTRFRRKTDQSTEESDITIFRLMKR